MYSCLTVEKGFVTEWKDEKKKKKKQKRGEWNRQPKRKGKKSEREQGNKTNKKAEFRLISITLFLVIINFKIHIGGYFIQP